MEGATRRHCLPGLGLRIGFDPGQAFGRHYRVVTAARMALMAAVVCRNVLTFDPNEASARGTSNKRTLNPTTAMPALPPNSEHPGPGLSLFTAWYLIQQFLSNASETWRSACL
jgi:hypothetical protein